MHPFEYLRVSDPAVAIASVLADPSAQYIAGGTIMIDLMKEDVFQPRLLVDISQVPMSAIDVLPSGGVRIGANVKNGEAARHPFLLETYPGLCEAILSGASQQIRNMASMAGNVLQRTRCPYLRDTTEACNKREPGSGCAAIKGYNRLHAIFGQTDNGATDAHTCIATYPSDMTVALAALDAVVVTRGPLGDRRYAVEDLLRLPGDAPHLDSNLRPGELIVAVEMPPFRGASHYLKVRDRASYTNSG